jgi:hypothetical protein
VAEDVGRVGPTVRGTVPRNSSAEGTAAQYLHYQRRAAVAQPGTARQNQTRRQPASAAIMPSVAAQRVAPTTATWHQHNASVTATHGTPFTRGRTLRREGDACKNSSIQNSHCQDRDRRRSVMIDSSKCLPPPQPMNTNDLSEGYRIATGRRRFREWDIYWGWHSTPSQSVNRHLSVHTVTPTSSTPQVFIPQDSARSACANITHILLRDKSRTPEAGTFTAGPRVHSTVGVQQEERPPQRETRPDRQTEPVIFLIHI